MLGRKTNKKNKITVFCCTSAKATTRRYFKIRISSDLDKTHENIPKRTLLLAGYKFETF